MSESQLTMQIQQKYDLSKFKITSILSINSNRKTACILGCFTDLSETDQALIILEKTTFAEEQFSNDNESGYFTSLSKLNQEFVNDIYGNFQCFPNPQINSIKTTIIYPATDKHIQKYSVQEVFIVQETKDIYDRVTVPYLLDEQFSLDWVYNILEHKKEAERILFEDPDKENGFILLPDLKWDGKTLETLYLLAIIHQHNIKSIRDLTTAHLPLLKNILAKGVNAIKEKYGVDRSQLRIYFHYQPSFYHLHVHFTYLKHEAPGIYCEKSHLLDGVINNIELIPDYYQKATLSFVVRKSDRFFEKYFPPVEVIGEKSE